jgi:hypothetical protein
VEGEIFRARPDRLWDPPILLYNGYRVFSGGKGGRGVALTTLPHLAPRLKKEYSYTSTPPLGLRGLFQGDLYYVYSKGRLTLTIFVDITDSWCLLPHLRCVRLSFRTLNDTRFRCI